jgi:tRNA/rRNA methyltransferase
MCQETSSLQPVYVLVAPQMGENIGAVARAMLNCGLTRLRLVDPRDGWPNARAHAMSAGALDTMPPVAVFPDISSAIADCQIVYATAAGTRDMVKPVIDARQAGVQIKDQVKNGLQVAVLFGRERSGLTNEELAFAHEHVSIPLNPDFDSLNLGQAALLMAYEFYLAGENGRRCFPTGTSETASMSDFNGLCDRLEREIENGGFFRSPDMRDTMMRNIRNFLIRGMPTEQELRTFHGVITALKRSASGEVDRE